MFRKITLLENVLVDLPQRSRPIEDRLEVLRRKGLRTGTVLGNDMSEYPGIKTETFRCNYYTNNVKNTKECIGV